MTRVSLCALLSAVLFAGCVTTEGTYIRDMDDKEPYNFSYQGTVGDGFDSLERMLISEGWEVTEEDQELGVLQATKNLTSEEKVSTTGITEAMAGAGTAGQAGRLTFAFEEDGDEYDVVLRSEVTVTTTETGAFSSSTAENTETPQQGHPLMVGVGLSVDDLENFDLIAPPSSKLRQAQEE